MGINWEHSELFILVLTGRFTLLRTMMAQTAEYLW